MPTSATQTTETPQVTTAGAVTPTWSWRRWWRQQSPYKQDRFAILAPLLAVVMFSLAIVSTLTYLRLEENERESETVQRDVEYLQQRMRQRLTHGQDAMADIAKDLSAGRIDSGEFVVRAEQLLESHNEIKSLLLVDATGKVRAAYASTSVFGFTNHPIGAKFKEQESTAAFQKAARSSAAAWTHPTLAPDGSMELHVPYFRKSKFAGVILAEYSVNALINATVPNELAGKYAVAVLNESDKLVAGTLMPKRTLETPWLPWLGPTKSYATPVTPMAEGLKLRAQSFRTSLGLLGSGLIWVVAVMSAFTIWLLMGTWRHTRKRLEAQQALIKETNFRRAMENSMLTGMRVLDTTGRITYVNPAFCQMTGWTERELLNQTPPYSYWPEEDHERLHQLLADELAGRTQAGGAQMRVKRKNGQLFDARMYVSPLIDPSGVQTGWMTSITDITEPNRVRDQLSAAQERFTTVLEGLDAAVSVAPLGSTELLFANGQYRQWFGSNAAAHTHLVAQAGVAPVITGDSTDAVDQLVGLPTDAMTQAAVEQTELFLPELDKWLELRTRYLNWVDGRLVQMVIASDITARRLAEEQAIRQTEKAQSASRLITMGEMASSVAHELNQPLTAISNYCTGLLARIKDNRLDEASLMTALEKTAHQAHRAGQIIQRIRAFVQRSEPNRSPSDVKAMVAEAVELAQIEFRRRRVRLTHFVAAKLPQIEVDPILIEQVMVNLLKNAAEAIDAAGLAPAKRSVDLRVVAKTINNLPVVEFTVTDTGKGIPPETLKRLYEAFFFNQK